VRIDLDPASVAGKWAIGSPAAHIDANLPTPAVFGGKSFGGGASREVVASKPFFIFSGGRVSGSSSCLNECEKQQS